MHWHLIILHVHCLCRTSGVKAFTICPWIHQFSNTWSYDDQLAKISIPDVNPCDLPTFGLFSMAAGDFLEVYNKPGIKSLSLSLSLTPSL